MDDVITSDDFNDVDFSYPDADVYAQEAVPTQPDVTLDDLLPTNSVILTLEEGESEPVIQVRGKYVSLAETIILLDYASARVKYLKSVKDRS